MLQRAASLTRKPAPAKSTMLSPHLGSEVGGWVRPADQNSHIWFRKAQHRDHQAKTRQGGEECRLHTCICFLTRTAIQLHAEFPTVS